MKRFGIILVCFLFIFFFCSLTFAATYDATGSWNYTISDRYNNCGDSELPISGIAIISQSGDGFSLDISGNIRSGGTISGATYTINDSYSEDGGITTETMIFTLNSATSGSGSGTWVWTTTGYSCQGGYSITLTRNPSPALPSYNVTGTWVYNEYNLHNNCGEPNTPESGTIIFSQSGSSFTLTSDGDIISGTIDGAKYEASGSFSEDGGITTIEINITFSSSNSGVGQIHWEWSGGYSCSGGSDLSLTKSSSTLPSSSNEDGGGGGGGGCFIKSLPY